MKHAELIALALAVVAVALIFKARQAQAAQGPQVAPRPRVGQDYWNSHENF